MKKIFRPLLQTFCLLGLLNTATPPASAQIQQPTLGVIPSQKTSTGFDSDPLLCDTSFARGWFYWYMDALGQCYIVPMSNPEEAARRADELISNSFYVVVTGYGLRDSSGVPVKNNPLSRQ
ncbi:hypothetical protein [Oscillatoria sp. FACHB-1406]|uniref:hypothetical protein n=1 Tax=Oscillatoria sp. FACHB-1406 TaxID=2692846 RepID=UPI0016881493|nr:hypothetical protein [Oscillatoria sp. FACHB-1406]MBD2578985.1 hypothetical protein [Oscillatoria sp. FACHB-1406]